MPVIPGFKKTSASCTRWSGATSSLLTPGTPRLMRGKLVVPHPTGLGFIRDDREDCMVLDLVRVRVPTRAEQKTVVEITELLEVS